jgi:hypothetical protein
MRVPSETPPDEFGVRQLNVFYNRAADLRFCFLEASSRESIENTTKSIILNVAWITEVQTLV